MASAKRITIPQKATLAMGVELAFYICYLIFGLFSINSKFNRATVLFWFLISFGLLMSVHLKEPMWDMVSYQQYSRIDNFDGMYFKREIVYFKILQILTSIFSFKGALLIIDALIISVVLRTFLLLKIPMIYWYLFFICFWSIMGYQNIHRQYVAEVLLMWVFAEFIRRELNSKAIIMSLIALIIPLVHNIAGMSYVFVFRSIFKKLYAIILPVFFILIVVVLNYLSSNRSSQESGFNFAYVYFLFFAVSGLRFTSRTEVNTVDMKMYKSFYFLALSISVVALFSLSVAGQERVVRFFIIVFFPYIMLGVRNSFKQKKFIDVILLLSLHVPIYFTDAYKFLVT